MHVLDLIGIDLSVCAASADGYRQFSAFALGRSSRNDGTCSYCTSVRPECMCRWAIPNSKSRLGSTRLSYLYMDQLLCPLRQRCHWCVQTGQSTWIIIKLESHQVQNLPKASLLTVAFGGSDHWLFLSDTAAMLRDLTICAKYESDPLSSTH